MSQRHDQHSALVHQRTDVRHRSTTLLLIKVHSDGCGITTSNLSPLESRIARSGVDITANSSACSARAADAFRYSCLTAAHSYNQCSRPEGALTLRSSEIERHTVLIERQAPPRPTRPAPRGAPA